MLKSIELEFCGKTIRGVVTLPPSVAETNQPAVILFHGYGQNDRRGPRRMFVLLGEALAELGFMVFRFDFLGCGESDGRFEEITLSNEIEQAKAILDFVREYPDVNQHSISLFGYSMGGAVASITAAECSGEIDKLVLLSPAGSAEQMPLSDLVTPYFAHPDNHILDVEGLPIGRAFVEDYPRQDLYARAKEFGGPVLLMHGTDDAESPSLVSQSYLDQCYGTQGRLIILEDADHHYSSIKWEQFVLKETIDFISAKVNVMELSTEA